MKLMLSVQNSYPPKDIRVPNVSSSNVTLRVPSQHTRVKLVPQQQTLDHASQFSDDSRRNSHAMASTSASTDMELAIRGATSFTKLLSIVEQHGARMERAHVHAMFVRAGKMMSHMGRLQQRRFNRQFKPVPGRHVNLPAPQGLLPSRIYAAAATPQATSMPPETNSSTNSSASIQPGSSTGASSAQHDQPAHAAPADEATNSRHTRARTSIRPDGPLLRRLMRQLLHQAQPYLRYASPVEAAHIVFALGLCTPSWRPQQQLDLLLRATQPTLQSFPGDCLAKLTWGLAALGHKPHPAWLRALDLACMAHSTSLGAHRSSVLLLAGLAGLRHTPDMHVLHDIAANLKPKLDWLMPHDMAALLDSLATLGCAPSPAFLQQFMMRSSSKLSGMSPAALAQLASVLARCVLLR